MRLVKSLAIVSIILLHTGCASVHVQANSNERGRDIDSVFGGITVDRGASVRDVSSVNGGIELKSDSSAREVDVVNGGIDIGDNVQLRNVETVNGGIDAGEKLKVEKTIETVNGDIEIGRGGFVGFDVRSVNGDIELTKVSVERNIKTNNGDIRLVEGTLVKGDLIVEKSNGFSSWGLSADMPVIEVDEFSEVQGTIHLYKPVELKIDENAKVGDIKRYYKMK